MHSHCGGHWLQVKYEKTPDSLASFFALDSENEDIS